MATNNIISSLGAGSGIDTVALVEGLVNAERIPKESQLDTKQEKLELQLSSYGVLANAMSTMQDSLELLGSSDTFNTKNVTFPDTSVLTPTAVDTDVLEGDYEIEVLALAKSHSLASTTFSDPTDVVGKGTLTFNFGTWSDGLDPVVNPDLFTDFSVDADATSTTITIDDSNNSLSGLRDAINSADFGVQASIVENGGSYQLLITAPSGANGELSITVAEDGATPTDNDASDLSRFAFNTAGSQLTANQAGADASLKVNGMTISRESNKIDDVVQGLDFTINKLSAGEIVSITISNDKAVAEQTVRDFVASYNVFYDIAKALITPADESDEDSEELNTDGGLISDPSARGMIRQLQTSISQSVTGLSGSYSSLSSIGIMTARDGTIEIDEDHFTNSFENNYKEIINLFTPQSGSSDSQIDVVKFNPTTQAGSIDVVVTTAPEKGYLNGGTIDGLAPLTLPAVFDPGTETFTTDLDTSLGDYSFKISVDGTESNTISLTDTFSTAEEVRVKLQSLINGDTKLQGVGAKIDVTYDAGNDRFDFISRSWGSSSKVNMTEVGTNIGELGITVDTGTAGVDAVGTINGEAAFGSGNIFLPPLGSSLSGLSLQIGPTATSATINLSQGFATQLDNIFETFMAKQGLIDQREDRINTQLDEIKEDRDELDVRLDKRFLYLQAQFLTMERILSSLSETGGMLDGLVDRLPFTYKS